MNKGTQVTMDSRFKTLITLLMPLALFLSCGENGKNDTTPPPRDSAALVLTHNSSVRISPLYFSARITQLNKGDSVIIIDRSSAKTWIGKSSDYWYRIKIKNGMTGWIFGQNLRLLKSGDEKDIEKYISKFWEKESDELKKKLKGKWWSINRFGDFTYHGLELNEEGTYLSYRKGGEKHAIKGEYNFDLAKNEIIFLKGTTFKSNLKYSRRGLSYMLHETIKEKELRFKKIQAEISKSLEKKKENAKDSNK